MSYPYRCSDKRNCGRRKSLRHTYGWYIRKPKCPGCGKDTLKFDWSVIAQRERDTCRCNGIHFPHRCGTYLNKNEFCKQIPAENIESIIAAEEMGVSLQIMKPDDECPF